MVEEWLPTPHFLVLNQCNGWVSAADSDAATHMCACIRVVHIHTFPDKEALSWDALCNAFLCHIEDEWAKISRSPSLHAQWSSIHLTLVQLNWTAQWSSNGLNTTSQLSSIVHLFSAPLCMTEGPHTAPLIMTWASSRWRDLMLPVSFSSEKSQRWQSDWIILNRKWQMCFQPSTGALLIYVTEEWERSCSFSLAGEKHFQAYIKDTTQISKYEVGWKRVLWADFFVYFSINFCYTFPCCCTWSWLCPSTFFCFFPPYFVN